MGLQMTDCIYSETALTQCNHQLSDKWKMPRATHRKKVFIVLACGVAIVILSLVSLGAMIYGVITGIMWCKSVFKYPWLSLYEHDMTLWLY